MFKQVMIIAIIAAMGITFAHVFAVSAQDEGGSLGAGLDTAAKQSGLYKEGDPETMLSEAIGKYVRIGLDLIGVVFLIIVLYGGLVWMTAGGKPENVDSAKKIIIQGALGLAVTLMAYQLTSFIIKQIGSKL